MGDRGANRLGAAAAWALALLIVCAVGTGARASDRPKADALKHALSEMTAARRTLAERGAEASELRARLHARVEQLRFEIAQERQQNAIGQFPQALRVERIGYNLRLAQRLYGYLERIDRRIDDFRAADQTLEFTMRRAHDDLLMVKVLEDSEISGLLSQVESVLNAAVLETKKPLLNASDPPTRGLESFWIELSRTP
jgi:hypothetical protein